MFKVILNPKPTKAACAAVGRDHVVRRSLPLDENGFVLTGYDEEAPDPAFPYLVVVDFDVGPETNLVRLNKTFDCVTFYVETGSGGYHRYFWVDQPLQNSQKKPLTGFARQVLQLKGVDIRGEGGIIFAPGCKFDEHKDDYHVVKEVPIRKITAAELQYLIEKYIWEPTEAYKRMRLGFRNIMNGEWNLAHDMNKTTGIDEWLYWSAFWREYLNCGGTVKEGVSHFTTTHLQSTFDEGETVRQLESPFFQKLGNKRPSNDFYFRLFPEMKDELKLSGGVQISSNIIDRIRTLEDGFHQLNTMFQDVCKRLPKRRY